MLGEKTVNEHFYLYNITGDEKHLKNLYDYIGPEDFLHLYIDTGDKSLLKYLIPFWVKEGYSYIDETGVFSNPYLLKELFNETLRVYKYYFKVMASGMSFEDLDLIFKITEKNSFDDAIFEMVNNLMTVEHNKKVDKEILTFTSSLYDLCRNNQSLNDIMIAVNVTANLGGIDYFKSFNLKSPIELFLHQYNKFEIIEMIHDNISIYCNYDADYVCDILADFILCCDIVMKEMFYDDYIEAEIKKYLSIIGEISLSAYSFEEVESMLFYCVNELTKSGNAKLFAMFLTEFLSDLDGVERRHEEATRGLHPSDVYEYCIKEMHNNNTVGEQYTAYRLYNHMGFDNEAYLMDFALRGVGLVDLTELEKFHETITSTRTLLHDFHNS